MSGMARSTATSCNVEAPTKELENISTQIDKAYSHASEMASQLEEVNNNLRGPMPVDASNQGTPCREGVIGSINDRIDSLTAALHRMQGEIERLREIA